MHTVVTQRIRRVLSLGVLAVAMLLAARVSQAAVGTPDAFGYVWYDNMSGCSVAVPAFGAGAVSTVDSPPGTMLGPFPMGFTMPFYGLPVNQIRISPAGYVTFSAQPSTMTTQALPNTTTPNHLIAVFWAQCVNTDVTYEASPTGFHVRWFITLAAGSDMEVHLFLSPDGSFRM